MRQRDKFKLEVILALSIAAGAPLSCAHPAAGPAAATPNAGEATQAAAPDATHDPAREAAVANELAAALKAACPVGERNDLAAKDQCTERLSRIGILRDRMREPFLWGTQKEAGNYDFQTGKTTRFNPMVWRRMYLPLEMYSGEHTIEQLGDRTVLHMATQFRNQLDPGEYPYPFWHSTAKWESYEFSVDTMFMIQGDQVIGAMRSAEQDRARPALARSWDGEWQYGAHDTQGRPPTTLYQRLFSASNPNVPGLDQAYRAFEAESRKYNCTGCHRPDNPGGQPQLEMLCYPNQALASRHTIVRVLERNMMPPGTGIDDDAAREHLLALARGFEQKAEAALAFEAAREL